jgi:Flp pilus assembly protein TadD
MAAVLPVFVTERYRVAAVPGLLVFAAAGLVVLWDSAARANLRRCALYLVLLAAATMFVSLPRRDRGLWALEPYSAGRDALEASNLPLAQAKLELAYAYVPDNAEVNLALGNLWIERKDLARAEHYYRAALQLDPHHKSAVTNLGVVALEQKQTARALGLFRASVAAAPADAKAHYLLARTLAEAGQRPEAAAEIAKAVQLQPDQPEFLALRDALADPSK